MKAAYYTYMDIQYSAHNSNTVYDYYSGTFYTNPANIIRSHPHDNIIGSHVPHNAVFLYTYVLLLERLHYICNHAYNYDNIGIPFIPSLCMVDNCKDGIYFSINVHKTYPLSINNYSLYNLSICPLLYAD